MTVFLSASVIVLGIVVLLLLGAVVEMYRSIEQLREYGGLIDRPRTMQLAVKGDRPSTLGVPQEMDSLASALILFLSDKCGTCRSIASKLQAGIPDNVFVIVDPGVGEDREQELSYDLDPEKTIIDRTGAISKRAGIDVTPSAIVVENGRISRGSTLPSARQFYTLLESIQIVTYHKQKTNGQAAPTAVGDAT
jgi:hypothetical protein